MDEDKNIFVNEVDVQKSSKFDITMNKIKSAFKKLPDRHEYKAYIRYDGKDAHLMNKDFVQISKNWNSIQRKAHSGLFRFTSSRREIMAINSYFTKLKMNAINSIDAYKKTLDTLTKTKPEIQIDMEKSQQDLENAKKNLDDLDKKIERISKKNKRLRLGMSEKQLIGKVTATSEKIDTMEVKKSNYTGKTMQARAGKINAKETKVLNQFDTVAQMARAYRNFSPSYATEDTARFWDDLVRSVEDERLQLEQAQNDLTNQINAFEEDKIKLNNQLRDTLAKQTNAKTKAQKTEFGIQAADIQTQMVGTQSALQSAYDELLKVQKRLNTNTQKQLRLNDAIRTGGGNYKDYTQKDQAAYGRFIAGKIQSYNTSDVAYQNALTDVVSESTMQSIDEQLKTLYSVLDKYRGYQDTAKINDKKRINSEANEKALKEQRKEQAKEVNRLDKETNKYKADLDAIDNQIKHIKGQLMLIYTDMQKNPLEQNLQSDVMSKMNVQADQLQGKFGAMGGIMSKIIARLNGIKGSMRGLTVASRVWHKVIVNIYSQIATLINPLNVLKRAWGEWINRTDNKAWANTFEVIKYNLVTAITPALEYIAKLLLRIAAIANIFTKKWAGVDLFDKSAWQAEKLKKGIDKVTSSLDELHDISGNEDDNNTVFDKGWINTDDLISPKVENTIEKAADKIKSVWTGVTDFVKKHPILTAGLVGAWLTSGIWGPIAGSLIGKGLQKLFGGGAVKSAVEGSGTALGTLWSSKFGTVLQKGLGVVGVAVGSYFTGKTAAHMTKYWDTMSLGEKIMYGLGNAGNIALSALSGFAIAGVPGAIGGAVIAGLSGIFGWATTTRDGVLSLKDAQAQYDAELARNQDIRAAYAEGLGNLGTAMAQLEELEKACGISGEELAKQVDNGTLSVDNMTSSQYQLYSAYLNVKLIQEQLKQVQEELAESNKKLVKDNLEIQLSNAITSDSYMEYRDAVVQAMRDGSITTEEAKTYFARAMAHMTKEGQEFFMESLPDDIKEAVKNFDMFKTSAIDTAEGMKSKLDKFGEWLTNTVFGWIDNLKNLWDWIKKIFSGEGLENPTTLTSSKTKSTYSTDPLSPNLDYLKRKKFPSYDIGTNYVPNDQLALVHQGETIIPAKYNKGYQPQDNELTQTITELRTELAALRNQVAQGINVKGEFKQRGSDLVAVVEKGRNKNGNQALSNPAYAR